MLKRALLCLYGSYFIRENISSRSHNSLSKYGLIRLDFFFLNICKWRDNPVWLLPWFHPFLLPVFMIMQSPQKIIYSPKIIIPRRNPSLVRINIRISYSSIQKCDYLLFTFDIKNSIWSQKGGKNNHCFKILVLVVFRSAVCFHIFAKISKYR